VRRLPEFAWYHGQKGLVRYSCEMWIGAQRWCRAYSLACADQPTWVDDYDFGAVLPPPGPGLRLNLGSGVFYLHGWTNVDLNPGVRVDLREDAGTLPSLGRDTVDEIFAGHLLEHVADVEITLARWYEVLKPGRRLTVAVPDCEGAVRLWREGRDFPIMAAGAGPDVGLCGAVTGYLSRAESAADVGGFQAHRRAFDRSTLHLCLKAAGFVAVREVDGHEAMYAPCSRLGWQIAAEARKPGGEE
jgi:hypothetical protein